MTGDIDAILATLYHPGLKIIEPGLERMERFLAALGNPERRIPPVIHVAGTNGKGSLVANLQAIFQGAGKRVHRYISPHLVRFNERIVVAGEEISDDALEKYLLRVQALAHTHPATFFEATTAAAFLAFADAKADVTLLEVGMGGRWDATNVIDRPLLTAITPVSLDHCEYLGDTLTKVAFEKAGILKAGISCVVGPQPPEALAEIKRVAAEKGAQLFIHGEDWHVKQGYYRSAKHAVEFTPALIGEHQFTNAGMALACIECILPGGISLDDAARGVAQSVWPGRLQCLQQGGVEIWLDGGHNPGAGEVLAAWAAAHRDKPLYLVCGMVQGKDSVGFLRPLSPYAAKLYAIAIPGEALSQTAEEIAAAAGINSVAAESLEAALLAISREACGPVRVLICGSLYLAGKVLSMESIIKRKP